jgi:acetate kinase
MKILVLNSGSSSQKACLYEIGDALPVDPPDCLWEGKIEWVGAAASISVKNSHGGSRKETLKVSSRAQAVADLLSTLWNGDTRALGSISEIDVVGHRIVHGGPRYEEPALITPEVKAAIAEASEFAPLHNGAELEGMEIVEKTLGPVPQVAVFDTGFHRKIPRPAAVYPGPYEWYESGIHRYGFHGINHQYCAGRAARILKRELDSLRLVICHLGNGCSLAAVAGGHSVDTTMGFTPLEGLMMGTRSGSVDPGVLTYLLRQGRLQGREIDDVLNRKSGLLGISGVSGDMREIQGAIVKGHARAKLAFEIYVHRLKSGIGAMTASLCGIDALIFTAGVGENSPETRAATCAGFEFLGIELDASANATLSRNPTADIDIASPNSKARILVIQAQEDWAIAGECWKLMAKLA